MIAVEDMDQDEGNALNPADTEGSTDKNNKSQVIVLD